MLTYYQKKTIIEMSAGELRSSRGLQSHLIEQFENIPDIYSIYRGYLLPYSKIKFINNIHRYFDWTGSCHFFGK